MEYLYAFGISLVASIIAVLVTLVIERYRLPKLKVSVDEKHKNYNVDGVCWLFYKIYVKNMRPFLPILIVRQTAENCHANIEFYKNDKHLFTMKGRWSSTPDMAIIPNDMWRVISNFPQPVSITSGESEHLDVIAQVESENSAYGFNNISYFHDWKYEKHRLEVGNYKIRVNISSQNGVRCSSWLTLNISDDIRNTKLTADLQKKRWKKYFQRFVCLNFV